MMNPDKVRFLIEFSKGSRLEVPVALAAVTGLRRGELLALRWANVDLQRGSVFVAESLEQTKMGVRFKAPKSKSSRRFIPLACEAVELLRGYRDAQEDARKCAPFYVDRDLVFCNPDGQPWPPDTFTVQFAQLAKNIGMKGFRFHDLRHAFASLTLADGTSIKEVQLLMGHSTANTTLSVYARAVEGLGRAAVAGLAKSLLGGHV
jgi:integrase